MVQESTPKIPQYIADIMAQHGVRAGTAVVQKTSDPTRFFSGNSALDEFLEGGLASGAVSEWGMPAGQGAREIVLSIVGRVTAAEMLVLWVNGQDGLEVYPPAWSARGVDLRFIRFATAKKPIELLKPVFLEPLFRLVVLDSPKNLSGEEWAFMARQARAMEVHVMVLQNFFLSGRRGNIWARLRVNCRQRSNGVQGDGWQLEAVRGTARQPLDLRAIDM
jgi:RecA/RadA recombinase